MTSLKKQTISGIKWTFIANIIQRVLTFGATVILARILSPADFGLFALAFVMIDGFHVFKSLGFDSALVRRKEDVDKAANTAFFLIPPMGIILFLILLIIAPLGAKFLNNSSVANVIRALAIIFVISCFGKVPQTILYRNMLFKYKSIAEISSIFVYVITAVTLALNKLGVWSLVIAYILRNLIQISIEWYFSKWKPTFKFDKKIAWEMFHFGKYVLAGGIVWFLNNNLDNIVVGKLLGVAMLGYYAISRNISNFLSDFLLGKMGGIMYPAYSKIQDDIEEVKRVMFKMLKYISIFAFPFSFGLFIFAPDILRIIFGEKWLPATDILRILCFVGIFNSLGTAIWPIFLARGQSKLDFQINSIQVAIFFILILPLSLILKVKGVGLAVLLSTVISFTIGLIRIKKILNIKLIMIFRPIKLGLICSLVMVTTTIILKCFVITSVAIINLVIYLIFPLLIYLFLIYLLDNKIIKEVKEAFV